MSWADKLIEIITPESSLPIIVQDPNEFLKFKEIKEVLIKKGYEVYYEEPGLNVRMLFEAKCRGNYKSILVINGEYEIMPDINIAAEVKSVEAERFFNNFDSEKIKNLTFEQLCKLEDYNPFYKLNSENTEKFIQDKLMVKDDNELSSIDNGTEINIIISEIEAKIQNMDVGFMPWFSLEPLLGKLGALVYSSSVDYEEDYNKCLDKVNTIFQEYISKNYVVNFSYAPRNVVTIDKVQSFILTKKHEKVAIFVIDGMNCWQWYMLKKEITKYVKPQDDKCTFSYLPSITAWARQSLFKGDKPDLSKTNSIEESLFKDFWKTKGGLGDYQISYEKVQSQRNYLSMTLPDIGIKIQAYVDNTLDSLMHGAILGNKLLYKGTDLWIKESHIAEYIKELKDNGFVVYITADHGNIDANVKFRLQANENASSKSKSKRFIQFVSEEQCNSFVTKHSDAKFGISQNCVYFTDTNAFSNSESIDTKIITHGGSHIMELLVPIGVI